MCDVEVHSLFAEQATGSFAFNHMPVMLALITMLGYSTHTLYSDTILAQTCHGMNAH